MLLGQVGRVSGRWFVREGKAGQSGEKVRDGASKVQQALVLFPTPDSLVPFLLLMLSA